MAQSFHKNLDIWKLSIELTRDIYQLTSGFPKTELYGLSDQLKRAAVSIPSNISEGNGRGTIKENIHFLYIARGSCSEVETQIYLAKELGFIDEETFVGFEKKCEELLIKLSAYIKSKKKLVEKQLLTTNS